MKWTELPDATGLKMTQHSGTWQELLERLRTVGTFDSKDQCPWIKLAAFGTKRTAKGRSLRHDGNVLEIHGVEGDYDGEVIQPEQAITMLEAHGIRALVYTSPSHTPDAPRWRVIAPLSTGHQPSARTALLARVNGAIGGVLAPESFTLSQSYYFGQVKGAIEYKVLVTFDDPDEGHFIDDVDELDEIAIGRSAGATPGTPGKPLTIGVEMFEDAVRQHGRLLKTGDGRREMLKSYIASRSARGTPAGDLRAMVTGIASQYFDPSDPMDGQDVEGVVQHFVTKDYVPKVDLSALLANAKAANEPRYRLLGWPELETLPPIRWRVRGVLPSTGVAAIYGPSKSGKSFLSFDMACAIAEGCDWFGYRTTPADVVLVCLEGEAGYKLRAQAWMQHHGRALPERLHLVMQPWKVTEPKDVADLAAVVPAGGVVFIDTMNRAAPNADENASRDMGQIIEGTKALQSLTGGLAVLVAHTGKDTSKGLRGHSSLIAALDGAIEVARDGNRRTWTADKVKDGQDGATHPFTLETLDLGHDDDGEPLTSCAVSGGADEKAGNWPKPLTDRQRAGMESFYRAALEHVQGSDDGQSVSAHLEQWRPEFYRTCSADDQDAKKKAFQRVRSDLVSMGRLSLENDYYRCPTTDTGLVAARLLASFTPTGTRDRDGTEPGHVPDSHPL